MKVEDFVQILGADFYTGVPDSQLKALCNYLMHTYGINGRHHIIAANEGNCTALAAGYHLATGKIPVVYMQNSGEGNTINPLASLCHRDVYGIPVVFVVGWRGQPGIHDEPQHVYQGKVTLRLLEDMEVETFVIDKDTPAKIVSAQFAAWQPLLQAGKQVAFVIKKGAFVYDKPAQYRNDNQMIREEIIQHIAAASGSDPIVSTTGKASRELFEIREANHQPHAYDFLTVGSMGHSSSIALEIAMQKPQETIWCIDGDGALLMHMGAMAVIGSLAPRNLIHVVINNGAHETVGGMPTAASCIDLVAIAKGCGYPSAVSVNNLEALDAALIHAKNSHVLSLIEVKCAIGARDNLGRPSTTPQENKENFMRHLQS